jgi:hypothetical protein
MNLAVCSIDLLKGTASNDHADYFEKTKNNEHIFIYCTAGRSSSTAFQRILNSSNEIWIWGEQNYLIDSIIFQINEMKRLKESSHVKESLEGMEISFSQNKHDIFYPNAIGNLESGICILNHYISNLLKPGISQMDRFGFKDIKILSIETIKYLKEMYPKSFFMFCFRDPVEQWPSVNFNKWWDYSNDVESFLTEYQRLSDVYLKFSRLYGIDSFIENSDLRDRSKLMNVMRHLGINKIDESLIQNASPGGSKITPNDKQTITESKAYLNYLAMKKLSASFHKKIQSGERV